MIRTDLKVVSLTYEGQTIPLYNDQTQTKWFTTNGTFTPPEGCFGWSYIRVNVLERSYTQVLTISQSTSTAIDMGLNHAYRYISTSGLTKMTGTSTITANGTYNVTNYLSATVQVGTMPSNHQEFIQGSSGLLVLGSTMIPSNACTSLGRLTALYLSNASKIGSYAFDSCSNLLSVYLASTSMVSISMAFRNTPMRSTFSPPLQLGIFYVPTSLYASYSNTYRLSGFRFSSFNR